MTSPSACSCASWRKRSPCRPWNGIVSAASSATCTSGPASWNRSSRLRRSSRIRTAFLVGLPSRIERRLIAPVLEPESQDDAARGLVRERERHREIAAQRSEHEDERLEIGHGIGKRLRGGVDPFLFVRRERNETTLATSERVRADGDRSEASRDRGSGERGEVAHRAHPEPPEERAFVVGELEGLEGQGSERRRVLAAWHDHGGRSAPARAGPCSLDVVGDREARFVPERFQPQPNALEERTLPTDRPRREEVRRAIDLRHEAVGVECCDRGRDAEELEGELVEVLLFADRIEHLFLQRREERPRFRRRHARPHPLLVRGPGSALDPQGVLLLGEEDDRILRAPAAAFDPELGEVDHQIPEHTFRVCRQRSPVSRDQVSVSGIRLWLSFLRPET